MNLINFIKSKFETKNIEGISFIEAPVFVNMFKKTKGNSGKTFKHFIDTTKLDYALESRVTEKLLDDITIDKYHHKSHNLFVEDDKLLKIDTIIEEFKKFYKDELDAFNNKIEIEQENVENLIDKVITENIVEPITKVDTEIQNKKTDFPIIELSNKEQFRDIDGNIVEIEVRGKRYADDILLRSKHVGIYLGIKAINNILQDSRNSYILDTDYTILQETSLTRNLQAKNKNMPLSPLFGTKNKNKDVESTATPVYKKIYLTMKGLIKVVMVSRVTNENKEMLQDWITKLVYTHKFGSTEERINLANELTLHSKCLQDLPGLYLIKIGTVKLLRESMNISEELYPKKECDNASIMKYGKTHDIITRYKQHISNLKYGQYSDKITLEWYILIPLDNLNAAENELKNSFKSSNIHFEFNDGVKNHTELIIVNGKAEKDLIQNKYKAITTYYPSKANEWHQMMINQKNEKDMIIDKLEAEKELLKEKHVSDILRVEAKLKDKDMDIIKIESENKLLKVINDNNTLKAEADINLFKEKLKVSELEKQLLQMSLNAK